MFYLARFLIISYLIISPIFPFKYLKTNAEENIKTDSLINSKQEDLENNLNEEDYVIGPGDVFQLKFLNNKDLQSEFKVVKDGKAYLPIIGKVKLEGLTLSEGKNLLKEIYSNELINPELQLRLLKERPINITIIGEVGSPGVYTIGNTSTDSGKKFFKDNLRVVDVIKEAGGLTKDSNIKNIELIRKLPLSKGGSKKATLNLYELVFNGNLNQNPIVFDGDFINVPKASNITKLPKTNLTNSIIEVYVVGEVVSPGKLKVERGTQLTQAVFYAGGPTDLRANRKRVQLVRSNDNGSMTFNRYDINLKKRNPNINPILENGDIIKVSPNAFTKSFDIISTATTPALNIFAIYKIFE